MTSLSSRDHLIDLLILLVLLGILVLYDFEIVPDRLHVGRQLAFDVTGKISHVLVAQRNQGSRDKYLPIISL